MRLRLLFMLTLFSVCFIQFTKGQAPADCGFEPELKNSLAVNDVLKKFQNDPLIQTRSVTTIPIKIWMFDDTSQSQYIPDLLVQQMIDDANVPFFSVGMEYAIYDSITWIESDQFAHFVKNQESALKALYYQPNVVNLYLFNSLTHQNGQPLCGYAKYPGGSDLIAMDKNCMFDGSTFVHELGHFWGLYHTHGLTNVSLTNELANGGNCSVEGDDVCDTPADPNLKNNVTNDCQYIGQAVDNNGQPFNPDPLNYMSYSHHACRSQFTEGQVARMQYVHEYLRNYLTFSNDEGPLMTIYDGGDICDSAKTVTLDYAGYDTEAIIRWDKYADGYIDYEGPTYVTTFDSAGNYHISMEIETDDQIIQIFKPNAVQIFEAETIPFIHEFSAQSKNYLVENPDEDETWFVTQMNALTNDYAITIDNYHNYQRGEQDAFTLPPILLNGQTSAILMFDLAYAWHGINYDDALKVEVSIDCGDSYSTIFEKEGQELATVDYPANTQWMPAGVDEWRNETLDLSDFLGHEVLIRFVNVNDFGNQLYVNHIEVDGDPALAHQSLSIKGQKRMPRHNQIKWNIVNHESMNEMRLEHSEDGLNFSPLMDIDLKSQREEIYDHRYAIEQDYYYRLAGREFGTELIYSKVEFIPGDAESTISIYPNPAADFLLVDLKAPPLLPAGYTLEVWSIDGQKALAQSGRLEQTFESVAVNTEALSPGLYYIQMKVGDIVMKSRFMKM